MALAASDIAIDQVLAEFQLPALIECPFCGGELSGEGEPLCPHCDSSLEAHQTLKAFAAQLLREASRDLASGALDAATLRLELAREIDASSSLAALHLHALAAETRKDYALAVQLTEEFGRLLEPASALATATQQRLRELEEVLRNEEGAKGFYNLALLRARQGYYEEALTLAERARDLAPHLSKPWVLLHKIHVKLRHFEDAQYSLERYHALEPADPEVMALAQHLVQDRADERQRRLIQQIYWGYAWSAGLILFLLIIIALRA